MNCVLLLPLLLHLVVSWSCDGGNCDPKWLRDSRGELKDNLIYQTGNEEDQNDYNTEYTKRNVANGQIRSPFHQQQHLGLTQARLIRELSNKRGTLERNFLRFGRSSDKSKVEAYPPIRNQTVLRKFLNKITAKLSEDNSPDVKEDGQPEEMDVDELNDAIDQLKSYWNDELHNSDKREKLQRNFLRFGRNLRQEKRPNSLEKNFLRFGRSVKM